MYRRHGKGLSLIELLTVVAIVGILVAIAVPNFLDSRTRAQIASVMSSEYHMATALEAYNVDQDTYPAYWINPMAHYLYPNPLAPAAGIVLSTPIEYLSSPMLLDPFQQAEKYPKACIAYATGHQNQSIYVGDKWPKNCFALISVGPDLQNETDIPGFPFYSGAPLYDSTNGTVSRGDVIRYYPKLPRHWTDPALGFPPDPGYPF